MAFNNSIRTVWVTGTGGLIGGYVTHSLSELVPGARVIPLSRKEVDLADFDRVSELFREHRPDLVIHCAGLTRTPECEQKPELAFRLNVEVTKHLAELASDKKLIFMSTDRVFDGRSGPYTEESPVNPLDVYGKTKAAAEKVVLENPRHIVIRTSLNGGTSPTRDRGFNEQMRQAWGEGKALTLFTDEFRCPIHASFTARAICELAMDGASGIFHIAGTERLSRWEIGLLLAERCPELSPRMERASVKDFNGSTRAPDLELSCAKVASKLSFTLPGFSTWLRSYAGAF